MQKTITQNFCDDCYKQADSFFMKFNGKDLCLGCVFKRVEYSATIIPIGKKCRLCKGEGSAKEFTGVGNDYNWEKCQLCGGSGQEPFSAYESRLGRNKEDMKNVTGKNG